MSNCEFIDLGLSVKWAKCNIGGISPSSPGYYFAWGQVSQSSVYSKSYCKAADRDIMSLYNSNFVKAIPIPKGNGAVRFILSSVNDAASVLCDGSRMPTEMEFAELYQRCHWTKTTMNGVQGYKVTGPNNNSIFLPFSGAKQDSSLIDGMGLYWSSSPEPYSSNHSTALILNDQGVGIESNIGRHYGCTIRPVQGSIKIVDIQ
jgi:hypothetical protein